VGDQRETAKQEEKKAQLAEDKFKVALKEEIGQGLIDMKEKTTKLL